MLPDLRDLPDLIRLVIETIGTSKMGIEGLFGNGSVIDTNVVTEILEGMMQKKQLSEQELRDLIARKTAESEN